MDDFLDFIERSLVIVVGTILTLYVLAILLHGSVDKPPKSQEGQSYVVTMYSGGEKVHRWRSVIGYRCLGSYTRIYFDDDHLDIVGGDITFEKEAAHASNRSKSQLA